jgi:hypothetical protein
MSGSGWYPVIVLAPVLGLAVYCAAQILSARSGAWEGPYASLTLGFFLGFAAAMGVTGIAVHEMGPRLADAVGLVATNIVTYLALAFGYFNFVNLTVASLRIRLLEEIQDAGGSVSEDRLLGLYDSSSVASIRLARLVRGGHLVERDARLFRGKSRFLAVARIFDALRWFIIGRQ